MCGRYQSWIEDDEILRIIEREKRGYAARFCQTMEVYPGTEAPVLYGGSICVRARIATWGYRIFASKEQKKAVDLCINARAETVQEKPTFREDAICGRILVPCSGYYEWKDGAKYHIGTGLLFLAGLCHVEQGVYRYVILTTKPTPEIAQIHDRMPLVIEREDAENWLYSDMYARMRLQKPNTGLYTPNHVA